MKNRYRLVLFAILFTSICSFAQIPVYNSLPSASSTIYLDFDGQYIDGTAWNYNGPLTLGPSGMNADQITEIFNRVSEDYRPFNINITTDSSVYLAAPPLQRMRVIVTVSSDWYGSAGGVSYIGSFTWGDNTPCFVFSALLGYKTKSVAEAASHEVGHTLGLNHQSLYDNNCSKITEYNPGTGSGEIAWAPIMGYGYSKNLTLWHNGANPYGCSNYQNDLGIITNGNNGFAFRADDYSDNTDNSATAVNFSNNQFNVNGVIEQDTDKDVFKFTTSANGNFHLAANPFNIGAGDVAANLDMQVELINSSKTVLATYNPAVLLSATIDTVLLPGTYYLRVQGVGNVNAPEYASLGSYTLNGTFTPQTILPLRRLELHGSNDNNKHSLAWIIEADETVTAQTLEVSTNGINFQTLAVLNNNARIYNYVAGNSGIYYCRLHVAFNNNTQYYSNTIVLKNSTTKNKPSVSGNFVHSVITINSPSAFMYSIIDYSGRLVEKGNLIQGGNMVSTANLGNGMYIIQFSNGQEQYASKFLKQ